MSNIISKTYNLNLKTPTLDLTKWERDAKKVKVVSKLNTNTNHMSFYCEMPEHVFNYLKDTEERYSTNPEKSEYSFETKKPFNIKLKSDTLQELLNIYNLLCVEAIELKNRNEAKVNKYIAIESVSTNRPTRDDFNHAFTGNLTKLTFRYFICYKEERKEGIISHNRLWRSDRKFPEDDVNTKNKRKWHYYSGNLNNSYVIIKWTQEREDFLSNFQSKLIEFNENMEFFLSKITDDSVDNLINNQNLLKLL